MKNHLKCIKADVFASFLHDLIYLYGLCVHEAILLNGKLKDIRDGTYMKKRAAAKEFRGIWRTLLVEF